MLEMKETENTVETTRSDEIVLRFQEDNQV